jgi:hypothetical protein
MKESKYKNEDDITRRYSETLLKASERGNASLFEKTVSKDAQEKYNNEKPVFYKKNENAPSSDDLDESIRSELPKKFWENPTLWIEKQPNIKRGEKTHQNLPDGKTIEELIDLPYDISKVKQIILESKDIVVVKRTTEKEQQKTHEYERSVKAYNAGIPTPKPMGTVHHWGNIYIFYEYIEGKTMHEIKLENPRVFTDIMYGTTSLNSKDSFIKELLKSPAITEEMIERAKNKKRDCDMLSETCMLITTLFKRIAHNIPLDNDRHARSYKEMDNYRPLSSLYKTFNVRTVTNFLKNALSECGMPTSIPISPDEWSNFFVGKARKDRLLAIDKLEKIILPKLNEMESECVRELRKAFFGIDLVKERASLEQLLLEKNIDHKDLARRNLLVPWDIEKNTARIEEGKSKLYILDWEAV